MGTKHTLGAAVAAGAESITLYCVSCSRMHSFTPQHALVLWGPDATFPQICQRARCSGCKLGASQAAPDWPSLKTGWGGEPSIVPPEWRDLDTENPDRWSPGRIAREAARRAQADTAMFEAKRDFLAAPGGSWRKRE